MFYRPLSRLLARLRVDDFEAAGPDQALNSLSEMPRAKLAVKCSSLLRPGGHLQVPQGQQVHHEAGHLRGSCVALRRRAG
eukprot:12871478-Alexandrium_andersonii.AAC.1